MAFLFNDEIRSQSEEYSFLNTNNINCEQESQHNQRLSGLISGQEESQNFDLFKFNEDNNSELTLFQEEKYFNPQNKPAQNSSELLESVNSLMKSIAPQQRRREENCNQPKMGPVQNNKRPRFEQVIPESREEDEEFYAEVKNSHSNLNFKGGKAEHLIGLKNQPKEVDRPIPNKNPRHKEVRREIAAPQEQVIADKPNRSAKKAEVVDMGELREEMIREMFSQYEEMNRKYLERKEKIKMLNQLGELFNQLYLKLEDLKGRTPILLEKSFQSYLTTLENYHSLFSFDDSSLDEQLDLNESKMAKIKETFSFN